MRSLGLLAYTMMVLGAKTFRTGNMYISFFRPHSLGGYSKISENRIVADNQFTTFEYIMGTLKSPETGKFLSFNEVGWLVLEEEPCPGFFLKSIPGFPSKSIVSFNGVGLFQYCIDKLIGFNSNCTALTHKISIIFEDF